jgi:hypothetical protein
MYGRCLAQTLIESFDFSKSGNDGTKFFSYAIAECMMLQITYASIFNEFKKHEESFSSSVNELITGIEETLNQSDKSKGLFTSSN